AFRLSARRATATSRDEEAEWVTVVVLEHVEELVLVIAAVHYQFGTQVLCPAALPVELVRVRHGEVEMQLHADVRFRPGGRLELLGPLAGALSAPAGIGEHQPVGVHGISARTGLVTGTVDVAEPLSIELGRPPRHGCTDDGVDQLGILRSAL